MTITISGEFIGFADDDGGHCGTGVIQDIIAWLRHHHGGGGGDPLTRVTFSAEARSELGDQSNAGRDLFSGRAPGEEGVAPARQPST